MNYQQILDEIYTEVQPELMRGKVADYIPALASVEKGQFAKTDEYQAHLVISKDGRSVLLVTDK